MIRHTKTVCFLSFHWRNSGDHFLEFCQFRFGRRSRVRPVAAGARARGIAAGPDRGTGRRGRTPDSVPLLSWLAGPPGGLFPLRGMNIR